MIRRVRATQSGKYAGAVRRRWAQMRALRVRRRVANGIKVNPSAAAPAKVCGKLFHNELVCLAAGLVDERADGRTGWGGSVVGVGVRCAGKWA